MLKNLILCAFIFSLFSMFGLIAAEPVGPRKDLFKIDEIRFTGIRKLEKEAVMEKIGSRPGMMLDNHLLRQDLTKIYNMKYFDQVEAHHIEKNGKNILEFRLIEKPIVKKITLKGNSDLGDDDLLEQIKTKEFNILDVNTIKADIGALQKHYEEKGYYLAAIDYEVKKMDKDNVEVIYRILEFDKVRVKKITFLGNKAMDDSRLRTFMETREDSLLSFFSGAGNFKEFNFQTDIERIKYFYKTEGYLQINVADPMITVSEDKKWVFITININEGPQFSINDIIFEGELLFSDDEMLKKIGLKAGAVYSEEKLRKDIQTLTELYQDQGYAFANVLRTLEIVPGENKVDVRFTFEKGKIAYFGKITVTGNSKTRDKVIRRELKIFEGMKYSGTALRQSKENVDRLGYFEPKSVLFNTSSPKGRDDVLDVEINVKERNTGQISVGAGYSTTSKAFLQASISQNNFLGLGQILSFSLSYSENNQVFNLGFTEPYLFDTKWTAGGDIFKTKNESSTAFTYEKTGFDIRVGYPIFDYTRLFMTYKFDDTKISSVEDPLINSAEENGESSSLSTEIVHDDRNNRFEPTDGKWLSVSLKYTGLGGKHKWVKSEAEARFYKSVWEELTLRTRFRVGKLYRYGRNIPRTEKYTLGGSRDLRGYRFEDIGPKKRVVVDGRNELFNVRGLFSVLGTAELEHPLVKEAGLKWVIFFDAGNVYNDMIGEDSNYSVKADYGFGFRWFSPIGVLRFEFGYPISRDDNQDSSQFHFDIGQLF